MKRIDHEFIKKHILIIIFTAFMAVLYSVMMFTNKPWYDELYTYYSFISRGPIYAAIHWPVPNNHVGYSVLSGFLDVIKNPYIRLRGVSVLAAVMNLALIYIFSNKFMDRTLSLSVAMLYAGAGLVYRLAFQGRGYTLAVTCYLCVLIALYDLSIGKEARRSVHVLFITGLILGLYIVPSSIYWVIPACMAGGIYMLCSKRYDRVVKTLIDGIIAALITFGLYTLIWLAIGANLISKDSESAYYGMHQLKVLLKAPFDSFGTGIKYMLASPYIQSIPRPDCIKGLPGYLQVLFENFYGNAGMIIFAICILGVVGAVIGICKKTDSDNDLFACIYITTNILIVPVMLLIQSVHPYKRVLSFYALPIAFAGIYLFKMWGNKLSHVIIACASAVICMLSLFSAANRAPLADRENDIADLLAKADVGSIENIFYTDDYQKYVLKFYYDKEPAECYTLEDAGCVLVSKDMYDPTLTEPVWPMLYGYSEQILDIIENDYEKVAETDAYALYTRQ